MSRWCVPNGEADIMMISHLVVAAEFGPRVIRMITLISSCCSFAGCTATLQMEQFGTSIPTEFGPKCSHLLGIQYLTVSDTTSYLYGKGNVSALKILGVCDFSGLCTAFGELEATREQIMEAGQAFTRAMYGQRRGTAVVEARYRLYTMKLVKLLKVMPPPLTKKHIRQFSQDQLTRRLGHLNVTSHTLGGRSNMASQYRPHTIKPLQVHCVRWLLEGQMTLTLTTDI